MKNSTNDFEKDHLIPEGIDPEKFEEALKIYLQKKSEELERELEEAKANEKFSLSPEREAEFDETIDKLLPKEAPKKKKNLISKKHFRMVAMIAVVVVILFASALTVDGFRNRVGGFFVNLVGGEFSTTGEAENKALLEKYAGSVKPTWWPEEYELQYADSEAVTKTIKFGSKNDKVIIFQEYTRETYLSINFDESYEKNTFKVLGTDVNSFSKEGTITYIFDKANAGIVITTNDENFDIEYFIQFIL